MMDIDYAKYFQKFGIFDNYLVAFQFISLVCQILIIKVLHSILNFIYAPQNLRLLGVY